MKLIGPKVPVKIHANLPVKILWIICDKDNNGYEYTDEEALLKDKGFAWEESSKK